MTNSTKKSAKPLTQAQLKAKLKKAEKERKQKEKEAVMVIQCNHTIEINTNPATIAAKANQLVRQATTANLENVLKGLESIVDNDPIMDYSGVNVIKLRRKFRPELGNDVDLIQQIAYGITTAHYKHQEVMLAAYDKWDKQTMELLLDSLGSPTFFSKNDNIVVQEKPYDVELAKEILLLIQYNLGAKIDLSKVNSTVFELTFLKSKLRAEHQKDEYQQLINDAGGLDEPSDAQNELEL